MKFLYAFIRLLRLPNLAIVFLTQYVSYWHVIRPAILKAGGIPAVSERLFYLISGATVLTTFGGYVINDYYDRHIDAVNKPLRVLWGRFLPAFSALWLYAGIIAAVHGLAFLIDREMPTASRWPLWVFPGISFLLFLYAWQFKCTALIGNLLVAILCGSVPVILLIPEERPLWICSFNAAADIEQAQGLIWLYALFAFLTNLLREQIKDLEDFKGDSECGCTTLAVLRGIRYAKKPAAFTGLTLSLIIAMLLYFWYETSAPHWQIAAGGILLLLPTVAVTLSLYGARKSLHFSRVGLLVKLVMVAGLFLLLRSWPDLDKIFF